MEKEVIDSIDPFVWPAQHLQVFSVPQQVDEAMRETSVEEVRAPLMEGAPGAGESSPHYQCDFYENRSVEHDGSRLIAVDERERQEHERQKCWSSGDAE